MDEIIEIRIGPDDDFWHPFALRRVILRQRGIDTSRPYERRNDIITGEAIFRGYPNELPDSGL